MRVSLQKAYCLKHPNLPFHLYHGLTLLFDELFWGKRELDAVCEQREAGRMTVGIRIRSASVYILPTATPRDLIVDSCLWPLNVTCEGHDPHASLI